MEKYLIAIRKLNVRFGKEWLNPAMEAVIEVAVQDLFAGTLTNKEYNDICDAVADVLYHDAE